MLHPSLMLSALLLPALLTITAPASRPSEVKPVKGTITVGRGFAPKNGYVFVILRPEGSADRGPPIAVLRIDKPTFPLPFSIGPENVMISGTRFRGPFDLYARFDQDGNPMSKARGDLFNAKPVRVKSGDKKVSVVLNKAR
ncbi:MAG: hypothetical protein KTR25_04355 [Myxococcales bacterium]|nr:hypothetical protein [Myxococcales bacterium]